MTQAGSLDYTTGMLGGVARRRLTIALVLAMLLASGGVVLWGAGLLVPRLGWPRHTAGWGSDSEPGKLGFTVPVENHGWVTAEIVGIGQDLPGLQLQPALTGLFPIRLRPGQQVELSLDYKVTSCESVPDMRSIPVRVKRPWGIQTVSIERQFSYDLHCQDPLDQS